MSQSGKKTAARLVTVDAESAQRRLDNFVMTELKGLPRARVYRMIRKGEVRVNKGRSKPAYRLAVGDIVRLPPMQVSGGDSLMGTPGADRLGWIQQQVVFEDEALLALDKPAGLAVHGGSGITLGAIELLRVARPECHYLELVHRLDKDTSGLLLIAKKRSALRSMHQQLRDGTIRKFYTALLLGPWQGGEREVDLPLQVEHRQGGERHVRVGSDGKAAFTRFIPERRFRAATLCRVEILTGRTHQIRVHASTIGHPVAGDSRYSSGEALPAGLSRLFLHATELRFRHPVSDELVTLQAELPPALARVIALLQQREESARG